MSPNHQEIQKALPSEYFTTHHPHYPNGWNLGQSHHHLTLLSCVGTSTVYNLHNSQTHSSKPKQALFFPCSQSSPIASFPSHIAQKWNSSSGLQNHQIDLPALLSFLLLKVTDSQSFQPSKALRSSGAYSRFIASILLRGLPYFSVALPWKLCPQLLSPSAKLTCSGLHFLLCALLHHHKQVFIWFFFPCFFTCIL